MTYAEARGPAPRPARRRARRDAPGPRAHRGPAGGARSPRAALHARAGRRHQRQGLDGRHAGRDAASADGRRVGLYTSPHLVSFRERIRVDGEAIAEDAVVDGVRGARHAGRAPGRHACSRRPPRWRSTTSRASAWTSRCSRSASAAARRHHGRAPGRDRAHAHRPRPPGVPRRHARRRSPPRRPPSSAPAPRSPRPRRPRRRRRHRRARRPRRRPAADGGPRPDGDAARAQPRTASASTARARAGGSRTCDLRLLGTYQPGNALLAVTAARVLGVERARDSRRGSRGPVAGPLRGAPATRRLARARRRPQPGRRARARRLARRPTSATRR